MAELLECRIVIVQIGDSLQVKVEIDVGAEDSIAANLAIALFAKTDEVMRDVVPTGGREANRAH